MKKLKVKKAVPVWHVWHVSEPVPSLSIKIRPGQILHPDRREKSVRPMACPQCGKCAEACPEGAITQNPKGVYMINKKKCTGCGKCAEACPFGLIVKTEGNPASKCIACGICAKACPMDVLEVVDE